MSTKIFDLYGEVSVKTDKANQNLKNLEKNAIKTAQGVSKGFGGNATQGVGRFTDALGDLSGASNKVSNLLGQLGEGLLTGGFIGAGFAAGAIAIRYLTEQTKMFSEAAKKAVNDMIKFKSATEDITFTFQGIDELNLTLSQLEQKVKEFDEGLDGWDFGLIEDAARSLLGVSIYLTDEELKQNNLSEEAIAKLKELRTLEEARLFLIKAQNEAGKEADTIGSKLLEKLTENRKRRGQIAEELKNEKLSQDEINLLQNENNKLVNEAYTLLGKNKVVKDKELTTTEQIRKKYDDLRKTAKGLEEAIASFTPYTIEWKDATEQLAKVTKQIRGDIEASVAAATEYSKLTGQQGQAIVGPENQPFIGPVPGPAKQPAGEAKKFIEETKAATEEIPASFTDSLDAMENISSLSDNLANNFDFAGKTFVQQLSQAINIISSIVGIIGNIGALVTGGPFSFLGGLFGKQGGVFANGRKIPGFATGGTAIVPPGFNENFPVMVSSGEALKVTKTSQVGNEAKLLAELVGVTKAQNKNMAVLGSEIKRLKLAVNIDGKELVKTVIKPNENRLGRIGLDLESL